MENLLLKIRWNYGDTNPIKGLQTKVILLVWKGEYLIKIPSLYLDSYCRIFWAPCDWWSKTETRYLKGWIFLISIEASDLENF